MRINVRSTEDGFVTIVVAGLAAVLLAAAVLVTSLAAVAVARHRAAAAADLAALSAAKHAAEGSVAACESARVIAQVQGAVLRGCVLAGLDVRVDVVVTPPGWLGRLGRASAISAAGPRR